MFRLWERTFASGSVSKMQTLQSGELCRTPGGYITNWAVNDQFIAVKITRSPSTIIIFQITQFIIFSYKTAIFQIHGNQSPKCCTTGKQLQFAASALSCVDPFMLHSNRFLFSSGLEGGLIIPKPQRLQKQRREKLVPCMPSRKLGKHPAAGWHNDWTP